MSQINQPYPRVGVGVCIVKDNHVLLGKRLNSHGHGTWAFPGGHLEFGESLVACAERELKEETGLVVNNMHLGPISEDFYLDHGKHYITIIMVANYVHGEPQLLEPHKCAEWKWFTWDNLPEPLFVTFENLKRNNIDLQDYFNAQSNLN